MRTPRILTFSVCLATVGAGLVGVDGARAATPATQPARRVTPKQATAVGYGGAVTSVDADATRIGLDVLRHGGNAADAAVATAALGVTEPYSSGIGGGGYFMFYDGRTHRVSTIDGRETAPAGIEHDSFVDPATGKPYPFTPDLVTSGVSVGVPGTPAVWNSALRRFGTRSLGQALAPAERLATRGFVVDGTFRSQTLDNKDRFAAFPATAKLFLPDGDAPHTGSVFRNPDLAATYRMLGRRGPDAGFYRGVLAHEVADVVQHPRKAVNTRLPIPAGSLSVGDMAGYRPVYGHGTTSRYRGYTVHGMDGSSAGGTTVGEALNILDTVPLSGMPRDRAEHYYLGASALAFADRAKYSGDPRYVKVPARRLLSTEFAGQRACAIPADRALKTPTTAGDVDNGANCGTSAPVKRTPDTENVETTNLTVSDRWGNVVEYTLTIEQTGGSGQVVPGRGFLLNNELTDFTTTYDPADPNRIEPGKRPRSSIAPTILTRGGRPVLALGSPGGSTIITTVLQILVNRFDLAMSLPEAVDAPRASLRNTATVTAEPAYITTYGDALKRLGYTLSPSGDALTSAASIGAATGIEFRPDGRLIAAAEPARRGGGAAAVVRPAR